MEQPTPLTDPGRTWAAVAHLAPLVGYFILIGQILLPLAILLWGPKSPLALFLLAITVVGLVVALPLALALLVLGLGPLGSGPLEHGPALAAGRGEHYTYALILRLVP